MSDDRWTVERRDAHWPQHWLCLDGRVFCAIPDARTAESLRAALARSKAPEPTEARYMSGKEFLDAFDGCLALEATEELLAAEDTSAEPSREETAAQLRQWRDEAREEALASAAELFDVWRDVEWDRAQKFRGTDIERIALIRRDMLAEVAAELRRMAEFTR